MFPSEMVILMAIAGAGDSGKKLLTRPMDITGEYIGYLYNSLVNRGYLKYRSPTNYQLTPIGREAIADFMKKNKTRSKDVAERLKMLGIDMNPEQEHKMERLEKKAVKVK